MPVERRWLGFDRRSIVPTAIATAVLLLFAALLPMINDAGPYNDKVVSGDVMGLSGRLRFTPTPGWGITNGIRVTTSSSTKYPASASVTDGAVAFTVRVDSYTGSPGKLLAKIRSTNDKTSQGLHIDVATATVTTSTGLTGVMARFAGTDSDGVVAAFVSRGSGIEVIAIAAPGEFTDQRILDVAGMIDSVRVVPGGAS